MDPRVGTLPRQVWTAVLESALDSIIVMDDKGIVREFNPAAQRTFGYGRDEAVGRVLGDLIVPPSLRERHHAGLRRYLATGEGPVLGRRIEIQGMRSDGSEIPVELAIVPFESEGARMFAGYVRDLSEREAAKSQIQRSAALSRLLLMLPLAASSARTVEEAVQASLEALGSFTGWPLGHAYFVDGESNRLVSKGIWWNQDPAKYKAFTEETQQRSFALGEGLPGRAWQEGQPIWVADLASNPSMPRHSVAKDTRLGAAMAFPIDVEGRVQVVLEFFATSIIEPDEAFLSALTLASSEIGRVIARLQDAEELAQANERLVQEAKGRRRFLSLAAHELGAPLTALRMQVALLRLVAKDERATKHLDVVERNVQRLQTLQRDLSDAGRIGAGRMPVKPAPGNLMAVARESVASLEPAARARNLQLNVDGADVQCSFDRERIGQVLDNLLRNAVRFTPPGGKVTVSVGTEGDSAVVRVKDTGYGIEPEDLARLFQPFSQVHDETAGNVGGSGLGLFISRGIAEAHGGSLSAQSGGRGKGSVFVLRLPIS